MHHSTSTIHPLHSRHRSLRPPRPLVHARSAAPASLAPLLTRSFWLTICACVLGLVSATAQAEPVEALAVETFPLPPRAIVESEATLAFEQEPPLSDLLRLPGVSDAERIDDQLVAAARRGTIAELEPRSGFRKRSRDLFRTERDVEIDGRKMRVRLRVRAKKRDTISIQVRF